MRSIRTKLIVLIALPTLLVYGAILGGTLNIVRTQALVELKARMTHLAFNYAGRFDGYLREAGAVAETSARVFAESEPKELDTIVAQLRTNVSGRPFIYGACAAFEPEAVDRDAELFAPYVHRRGEDLVEMNISRDVYDWYADPAWTWFQEAKKQGHPVWSAPYFDDGAGNVHMTTYSVPFYKDGTFRGVATVDIDLPHLQRSIGEDIVEGGHFMILAGNGQFVFDRATERILRKTLFDIANEKGNEELARQIPAVLSGEPGASAVPGWDSAEKQWLFYAPIPSTGWTFVAYTPERLAMGPARRSFALATAALAGTLILIIACIALMSSRITRPLTTLTDKVREIAEGNLETRIERIKRNDELGTLARAFNTMADHLREHIRRLAEEEAARRKIENDLAIAREIQRGLLPRHNPNLPGYDLAGWSQPADETGGDYYDWQLLSNGRLAVTLADVTGHGIGPALVTADCRAYARASFVHEEDVGKIINDINVLMCEDLRDGRFITFVVAMLDPTEHELWLLSAGHGPLFYYEAAVDCVHEYPAHQIPLGVSPHAPGSQPSVIRPAAGDILVLLTDGFVEWSNRHNDMYGSARVSEVIKASRSLPSARIIENLVADVMKFSEGTAQLDDLTAVVLKRREA